MSNFLRYKGVTTRGLSPALWGDAAKWVADMAAGRCGFLMDDFIAGPYIAATGSNGLWYAYLDTSNLITKPTSATLASGEMGLCSLYADASDNDSPAMCLAGGNIGAPFKISDTAGEDFKLAFECRFQVTSVADDVQAIFLGLGEEGIPANDCMVDDTGVMADKDYIGFNSVHVNSGTTGTNAILRFAYRKSGQTAQTKIAALQTMVASTWYKVGFLYDPAEVAAKRIKVFLDGDEQSTYVTETNIATATFPDGEEIVPTFISKAGTGTASSLILDWMAVGQYVDDAG
jgi:hypothetical protein